MKRIVSIILVMVMLAMFQTAYAGLAGDYIEKDFFGKRHQFFPCSDVEGNMAFECNMHKSDAKIAFFPATLEWGNVKDYTAIFKGNAKTFIFEDGIPRIELNVMASSNEKEITEKIIIPSSVKSIHLDWYVTQPNPVICDSEAAAGGMKHGQVYEDETYGSTMVFIQSDMEKEMLENEDEYGYMERKMAEYMEKAKTEIGNPYKKILFYVKSGSYAEQYLKSQGFNVKSYVSLVCNGTKVISEQPAIISGSRTLVPFRAALETMGATVAWDDATKTVTSKLGNIEVKLSIGSNQMYVNGVVKKIDVPAQIIDSRTMIPIRAVAEALGCNVGWDDATKTATITMQ